MHKLTKKNMSPYELSFLIMVVGLHVQAFYSVYQATANKTVVFYILLTASVLLFCQYTMRYIGIIHKYNSESTVVAWIVSFLVFLMTYTLTLQPANPQIWFLCFALTSGSATLKDLQCVAAIPNNPSITKIGKEVLIETAIIEASISFLFFFVYLLSSTKLRLAMGNLDIYSLHMLGAAVALLLISLFTIIVLRRAFTNRSLIENTLKAGNR